jgi:hypothetical protein
MVFLRQTQLNGFRDESGYPIEVVLVPRFRGSVEWRRVPPHGSVSRLIFACTRVDTCHPGNCMQSICTLSSHHLGTHGSFQKGLRIKECAHGFLGNNIKILFQA